MSTELQELPDPPAGRDGWPWTSPTIRCAPVMSDGRPWPRVTIVTPSLNQGEFLEATIRSVLLQGYPSLEYMVLDGGSTDESVDVINRYSPWLCSFRSRPDAGQAAAVAEGWRSATGDIVAYLNSDDIYLPHAIAAVAERLVDRENFSGVVGAAVQIDEMGRPIGYHRPRFGTFDGLLRLDFLPQPAVFVRKSAVDEAGGIDPDMKVAFDLELWLRIAHAAPFDLLPDVLAATRLHEATVTTQRRPETGRELERIARKLQQRGLLTRRQRARLRGSVAFVRASIHLDDFPRFAHLALFEALAGTLRYPPTGLRIVAAAFGRMAQLVRPRDPRGRLEFVSPRGNDP